MARVYRHQYRGGRLSKKWYLEYRNHDGKLIREPAYRSKELSQGMLGQILERIEKIQAGVIRAHEGLPASPVADLLDRWEASQLSKGLGSHHVCQTRKQVESVCMACNFFDAASLNAARAQDWLEKSLRDEGWTNRTYQQYRASLHTFGRWLSRKEKILPANPFVGIDPRNPELNRKIVRRVLNEKEFDRLIDATRNGCERAKLSGIDRAMLYTIAANTGLRLQALLALTPAHFNLGKSPTVTSELRAQKNRKPLTIPLPASIAAAARKWIKGKSDHSPLWPVGSYLLKHAARMLRFDLQAAGIAFKNAAGERFDFHSLRHQFATRLVRSGAGVAEVQALLDHSSPTLSARYFGHLRVDELRESVNRMK